MLVLLIFIRILLNINAEALLLSPSDVTTPYLIRKAGYPVEEHEVTTSDGYILTLHRIPPQKDSRTNQTAPIAYMMHGILASSSDWVATGPGVALGYLLADEGFDVWMGNSRGNRYSKMHTELDSRDPKFWDFSFSELGTLDLPAIFEYIYKETGVKRFRYFAHSQGTTNFFALCSALPKYNDWITAAHLLAPFAFASHIRSPVVPLLAPLLGQPTDLPQDFGSFDLLPNTKLFHIIGLLFCNDYSFIQPLCTGLVEFTVGYSNSFNTSLLPLLTALFPAGSSFKQVLHIAQLYESGHFRHFDYSLATNLQKYKVPKPPEYNLGNIRVPTYLYYSENDFFAVANDILYTISHLQAGVVRGIYKVPPKKWNHLDFLYGMNLKEILNDKILADVKSSS